MVLERSSVLAASANNVQILGISSTHEMERDEWSRGENKNQTRLYAHVAAASFFWDKWWISNQPTSELLAALLVQQMLTTPDTAVVVIVNK